MPAEAAASRPQERPPRHSPHHPSPKDLAVVSPQQVSKVGVAMTHGTKAVQAKAIRLGKASYLAKLSSEPGARGAMAEAESEKTSTNSPPAEDGGPVGAGGAAPSPSRSADGEGVD